MVSLHINNLFEGTTDYSCLPFSFSYKAFSKRVIKISSKYEKKDTSNTCVFIFISLSFELLKTLLISVFSLYVFFLVQFLYLLTSLTYCTKFISMPVVMSIHYENGTGNAYFFSWQLMIRRHKGYRKYKINSGVLEDLRSQFILPFYLEIFSIFLKILR